MFFNKLKKKIDDYFDDKAYKFEKKIEVMVFNETRDIVFRCNKLKIELDIIHSEHFLNELITRINDKQLKR